MANSPQTPPSVRQASSSGLPGPATNSQYHRLYMRNESDNVSSDFGNQDAVQGPLNRSAAEGSSNLSQKEEAQPPPKERRYQGICRTYDKVTADHWTYELIALFVCIATLISIVVVLLTFENGPTPHIMHGVSVSSYLMSRRCSMTDGSLA